MARTRMSNLTIYKHNDLIENFIFNATELELQILNYAVATTNPKWENKNLIYRISTSDLVAVYKTKSNNSYHHYSKAFDRLMKRNYSFYIDDEKKIKRTENVVIRVDENASENWFEFKFNEYISQRISNLQGLFTKYDINHIAMFKSRYAFILYEFFIMRLKQLQNGASKYSQTITVETFKENLDLSEKYKRFNDLEKFVLDAAKKNINKHSNIRIYYEVIRKGRTPTHLKFIAQFKKGQEPDSVEFQDELPLVEESKVHPDAIKAKAKGILANIKAGIF